jgi:adenosylcobinamide kinase / adenosylcobinamide-phosphate guanylyltransferase
LIFLVGGARSGKSSLATSLAKRLAAPVRFIATSRADDEEMASRVEEHRRHRPGDWKVVEAPIDLETALRSASEAETVVVDCVTLWISNLMVERDDATISQMVDEVIVAIGDRGGETIVVSNEVGSGIVPMHPVGRRFRDVQGRANQSFARAADAAYYIVAGKALRLLDVDDGH